MIILIFFLRYIGIHRRLVGAEILGFDWSNRFSYQIVYLSAELVLVKIQWILCYHSGEVFKHRTPAPAWPANNVDHL